MAGNAESDAVLPAEPAPAGRQGMEGREVEHPPVQPETEACSSDAPDL